MDQEITVLAEYVLVKQTMTSKSAKIILRQDKNQEDNFRFKFEIVQIGDECKRKIKVGDKPVFEKHVDFQGVKLIEQTDNTRISLVIVHENSIIAIDNTPDEPTLKSVPEVEN